MGSPNGAVARLVSVPALWILVVSLYLVSPNSYVLWFSLVHSCDLVLYLWKKPHVLWRVAQVAAEIPALYYLGLKYSLIGYGMGRLRILPPLPVLLFVSLSSIDAGGVATLAAMSLSLVDLMKERGDALDAVSNLASRANSYIAVYVCLTMK